MVRTAVTEVAGTSLLRQRGRRRALGWVTAGVAVLALGARWWPVAHGGGLHGLFGYDDGVYYTGAASLVFGRVPYRDFVLLHPPGMLLVLAPFAALGRWTSDPTGFAVARLAFMALGALNAALVARVLGRFGLAAAAAGGVFYALWYPSVYAERTTLLEPLGTTGLLVAVLLLGRTQRVTVSGQWLAGAALGAATATKVWGLVPLAVLVLWQLRSAGRRVAARVLGGAAVAVTAVCLPFFLLAPGPMFRMVVLDQVGRSITNGSPVTRLIGITAVGVPLPGGSRGALALAAAAVLAVGALAAVVAWQDRRARILVVLAVACGFVVMASPSYFPHYGEMVAAPAALVWGVAAGRVVTRAGRRGRRAALLTAAAVTAPVVALGAVTVSTPLGTPFPGRELAAATDGRDCVVADVPTALIEVDALSRSLGHGCRVMVDLTGLTYDRDAMRAPNNRAMPRLQNPLWQRDLLSYLTSGSATVLARPPATELSGQGLRTVLDLPLLARVGPYRVYGRP